MHMGSRERGLPSEEDDQRRSAAVLWFIQGDAAAKMRATMRFAAAAELERQKVARGRRHWKGGE